MQVEVFKYASQSCKAIQLNRSNIDQVRRFSGGREGRLVVPTSGKGRCWCAINDNGEIYTRFCNFSFPYYFIF